MSYLDSASIDAINNNPTGNYVAKQLRFSDSSSSIHTTKSSLAVCVDSASSSEDVQSQNYSSSSIYEDLFNLQDENVTEIVKKWSMMLKNSEEIALSELIKMTINLTGASTRNFLTGDVFLDPRNYDALLNSLSPNDFEKQNYLNQSRKMIQKMKTFLTCIFKNQKSLRFYTVIVDAFHLLLTSMTKYKEGVFSATGSLISMMVVLGLAKSQKRAEQNNDAEILKVRHRMSSLFFLNAQDGLLYDDTINTTVTFFCELIDCHFDFVKNLPYDRFYNDILQVDNRNSQRTILSHMVNVISDDYIDENAKEILFDLFITMKNLIFHYAMDHRKQNRILGIKLLASIAKYQPTCLMELEKLNVYNLLCHSDVKIRDCTAYFFIQNCSDNENVVNKLIKYIIDYHSELSIKIIAELVDGFFNIDPDFLSNWIDGYSMIIQLEGDNPRDLKYKIVATSIIHSAFKKKTTKDLYDSHMIEFALNIPDILQEVKSVPKIHLIFLEIVLICDPKVFRGSMAENALPKIVNNLQELYLSTEDSTITSLICAILDRYHRECEFIEIPIAIEYLLERLWGTFNNERLKIVEIINDGHLPEDSDVKSLENTLMKLYYLFEEFDVEIYMSPVQLSEMCVMFRDDLMKNPFQLSHTGDGYQAILYTNMISAQCLKFKEATQNDEVIDQTMILNICNEIDRFIEYLRKKLDLVGSKNFSCSSNMFVALCQMLLIRRPGSHFSMDIPTDIYQDMGNFLYTFILKYEEKNHVHIDRCLKFWILMQKHQKLPIVSSANKVLLNYGYEDSLKETLEDLISVLLEKPCNRELFIKSIGFIIYAIKHYRDKSVVKHFTKKIKNIIFTIVQDMMIAKLIYKSIALDIIHRVVAYLNNTNILVKNIANLENLLDPFKTLVTILQEPDKLEIYEFICNNIKPDHFPQIEKFKQAIK